MKKNPILIFLLFISLFLTAETAELPSAGEVKVTGLSSLITANTEYNGEGIYNDYEFTPDMALLYGGLSLEFGITPRISGAVLWAPGTALYSELDNNMLDAYSLDSDDISFKGPSDIFVGIKYLARETEDYRLSLGVGTAIPLDKYDRKDEIENYNSDNDYRITSASTTESLGFMGQVSFDYLFSNSFYLNLFSQASYYLTVDRYEEDDMIIYGATYEAALDGGATESAALDAAKATLEDKVEYAYGISLQFEVEPVFTRKMTHNSRVIFGLPLKYQYSPDYTVKGQHESNSGGFLYTLSPRATFETGIILPLSVQVEYSLPLWGINEIRAASFSILLSLTYDFIKQI